MSCAEDTIFALSTPPGRAGIAVVRLSGPAAGRALGTLTGNTLPPPRVASIARLRDPVDAAPIDHALVLWFAGPASFTGEDMVELHLHGSHAVVAATIETLARMPGLRLAEPGEFTRRAFDNGRLDLSEVEGLADLIDAETEAQRRQALRQMAGELSRMIEGWRARLLPALAHLEAAIDFPEDDLPGGLITAAQATLGALCREIADYLADGRRGERLREGLQIAIIGPPNSGKSSLLNALARRDVAIVSETAGTTRDVIEVHLDLGGYPVTLADTAGLRGASDEVIDPIEREGMRRARRRAEGSDLKLVVMDIADGPDLDPEGLALVDVDSLVALNKTDLKPAALIGTATPEIKGRPAFAVSAKTGQGLDKLLIELERQVTVSLGTVCPAPAVTRTRHRQALQDCCDSLARAAEAVLPELAAEDLRLALRALGRITGRVDVEDVLDVIFQDFCIGK